MKSEEVKSAIEACRAQGVNIKLIGKTIVLCLDGRMIEELGDVSGPAEALTALKWLRVGYAIKQGQP